MLHLFTKVSIWWHIKSIFLPPWHNGIFMLAVITQRFEASLYWSPPQCSLRFFVSFVITFLKKKKNNAFSSDLSVATDGQIPAMPCSSSSIHGGCVHLQGRGVSWGLSSSWVLSLNIPWASSLVPLTLHLLQSNFEAALIHRSILN